MKVLVDLDKDSGHGSQDLLRSVLTTHHHVHMNIISVNRRNT